MFEYLENLRKRPEPERKRAVMKIASVITLVIVVIWSTTLWIRVKKTDFSLEESPASKNMPSLFDSFSIFKERMGNIFGNEAPAVEPRESETVLSEPVGSVEIE